MTDQADLVTDPLPESEPSESLPLNSSSGSQPEPTPWGFWSTVGWTCLILTLYGVVQSATVVLIALWVINMQSNPLVVDQLDSNGFIWACATLVSGIVGTLLTGIIIWSRKGITVKRYLDWSLPSPSAWRGWILGSLGLIGAMDGLRLLLGRPLVPDVFLEAYQTAGIVPLFVVAIAIVAPIFEEILFRGFFIKGLQRGPIGAWPRQGWQWGEVNLGGSWGAVLISAGIWAIIHGQYDGFDVLMIFIVGLYLGQAFLQTRSLMLPIAIHILNNLISMIQTALTASGAT